jgi:hypothetical protein
MDTIFTAFDGVRRENARGLVVFVLRVLLRAVCARDGGGDPMDDAVVDLAGDDGASDEDDYRNATNDDDDDDDDDDDNDDKDDDDDDNDDNDNDEG